MHVPLPSDYLPYDANEPANYRDIRRGGSIYLAFMTIMVYDHLITFDIEVERIWSLKWRLPKFLFLINRYVAPSLIIMTGFANSIFPVLFSFCNFLMHFKHWTMILALGTSGLILLIRVAALYGHSEIMLRFLVGLFVCQMVTVIVITCIIIKETTPILVYEFFPGCYAIAPDNSYSFYIPFVIFDGILLILSTFKVFAYFRQELNPTVRLLARDSIVYFVIMFAAILADVIIITLGASLIISIPPESIACIAVSRMMLNIRGLVFDDPHGTAGVNLTTLQFDAPKVVTEETCDDAQLEA